MHTLALNPILLLDMPTLLVSMCGVLQVSLVHFSKIYHITTYRLIVFVKPFIVKQPDECG